MSKPETIEFEEVKTIPKAKRGKSQERYDVLYNGVINTNVGFKGRIKVKEKEIDTVRNALIIRRDKDEDKDNFKPFFLMGVKEKGKPKELFFRRISKESKEWKWFIIKRDKKREERKKKE